MKAAEIRELSADDLQAKLKEARAELFNLRFQMATSQLDNTARVGQVKKDIARIQTEMKNILKQEKESQRMLEEAFRGIGYGIE